MSNILVAKAIGDAAAPIVEKAIEKLRGIIDEVAGGEEARELRKQAQESLKEVELAFADRDAKIFEQQTKLAIAEAQGAEKVQRIWRPISALAIVATTLAILVFNLVVFPILNVAVVPESWGVFHILIPAVFTLLGVQVAGRSFEKVRGSETFGKVLTSPLPRDRKSDAKSIARKVRAWKKAGLSPEQIGSLLESEDEE